MEDNELKIISDSREAELLLSMASPYKAPEFKAIKNKDIIPFLDNDGTQFPDKLIYYKNNAPTHGSILSNVADQVAGNGFEVEEGPKKQETIDFLGNFGANGEDAFEILEKMAGDLIDFKGISLLLTWSADGKKILKGEHYDFSKIRSNKVNSLTGKVDVYWYDWEWNKQRRNPIPIPAFNIDVMADQNKAYSIAVEKTIMKGEIIPELKNMLNTKYSQMLYMHPYASNEFYYPLPYYVAGINAINASISIDQYSLGMINNNLSSNHIINFKGNYTPDQWKQNCREFDRSYIRGIKKGLPIMMKSKDENQSIEVISIQQNGKDEKFKAINESSRDKILQSHNITSPMLVGIREAGSLGGSTELETASNLFYRNTIRPKQNYLIKIFNIILNINELNNVTLKRLTLLPENTEAEESKNTNKEI